MAPPLPTTTDIVLANLLAERVLMRETFLELKQKSKYFYNVEIQDVPWSDRKLLPKNMPPEFLAKYPFDFKITFDTLGCNMLKCYKHNYKKPCKGRNPTLINDEFFHCQSACYQVFEDINTFLMEKFHLSKEIGSRRKQHTPMEMPFETMSIQDAAGCCFCGTQLTDLKRFALLPSARWFDSGDADAQKTLDANEAAAYLSAKYQHQPVQRRRMSGLVDAPPLGFNVANQTINFNRSYCKRFVREYSLASDACYTKVKRKVAGFLFGDSFVRQFPDLQDISLENFPFEYIHETITGNDGIREVNKGYEERPVSGERVSEKTHHTRPDKKTQQMEVVEVNEYEKNTFFKTAAAGFFNDDEDDGGLSAILLDMVACVSIEMGAEVATVSMPKIMAKLIEKRIAPQLIRNTIHFNTLQVPLVTRVTSLLIRTQLANLSLKLSLRFLSVFAASASFVFAIGLITLVPDIVLSMYNVGGFNNELTREMVDGKKRQIIDKTIDIVLKNWGQMYLPLVRDPADNYASPLITPEFVYNLGVVNFVKMYPDLRVNIGHTGIPENHLQRVAFEYLAALTVNSAGQTIDKNNVQQEEKEEEEEKAKATLLLSESSSQHSRVKSNTSSFFLRNDTDLGLLQVGIFCWVLSLLLFVIVNIKSKTLVVCGMICFIVWFTFIKLSIQRLKKRKIIR